MAGEAEPEKTGGKPSVKTFACANCGAPVSVRAAGHTVAVGCQSCGTIVDVTDENHRIINEAQAKMAFHPAIPLGKRGTLRGEKFEVIGFMVRSDASGVYSWREYLLFNPYKGFRWLTEYKGHWNYVITTRKNPASYGATATYLNKTFSLYNRSEAKVVFVIGEFYWRVRVGETVNVEDFIAPPEMLSRETSAEEDIWSIAEYIEADTIAEAFKPDEPLPAKIGVAPNQPSRLAGTMGQMWKHTAVFLGIIVVIQIVTLIFSPNELVYHNGFTLMTDKPNDKFTTQPFSIKGRDSNLEFTLEAPVDNSWIDVDIELVNDATSDLRQFSHGVEYYHGRDSDGTWTEGATKRSVLLDQVPAGLYHMNIDTTVAGPTAKELLSTMKFNFGGAGQAVQKQPSQPKVRYFELTVRRGVATWSAFVLAVIAVLAYPLVALIRQQNFEVKRWEESDYSPYQTDD